MSFLESAPPRRAARSPLVSAATSLSLRLEEDPLAVGGEVAREHQRRAPRPPTGGRIVRSVAGPTGATPFGLQETQSVARVVGVEAVELGFAFAVVAGQRALGAEEQRLAVGGDAWLSFGRSALRRLAQRASAPSSSTSPLAPPLGSSLAMKVVVACPPSSLPQVEVAFACHLRDRALAVPRFGAFAVGVGAVGDRPVGHAVGDVVDVGAVGRGAEDTLDLGAAGNPPGQSVAGLVSTVRSVSRSPAGAPTS